MRMVTASWLAAFLLVTNGALGTFAQESWLPVGPADTQMRCAAVSPTDANVLLAGGEYLHASTDGGDTWLTESAATQIWSVAFGSNSSVAYAGGWGSGVWFSDNSGVTWTQRNVGLSNFVIKALAVSPADDLLVFAGAENGIYRSVNGGMSWSPVEAGINVGALAIAASNPDQMYAGTWGTGLWTSDNGGATWSLLVAEGLPAGSCNALAVDSADAAIVYATLQSGGVWRSFDYGGTWEQITPAFEGLDVALDPSRPGFVYGVGGWTDPQRSGCHGGLDGWRAMDTGWNAAWFARGITVAPTDPGVVYACGTTGGLLRWVSDTTPPSPATGLTADDTGGAVELSWPASAAGNCSGYWIYRWQQGDPQPRLPYTAVTGAQTTAYSDADVEAGITFEYAVAAVDDAENPAPWSNIVSATIAAAYDLDVAFISRLPRDTQFYRVEYPNGVPQLVAGTENDKRWPALGETVTFVAHVVNKGTAPTPSANYRWTVNGSEVATGTLATIGPRRTGTATLDWTWNVAWTGPDHTDQTLGFEVDYDDQVAETFEQNNALTDYLEGMSLDIYVEPAIYSAFDTMPNLVGTFGFEDWIQAQVAAMNANFARSVYSLAPQGCLERVRIDRIIVSSPPGANDGVADGRWSFTGSAAYATTFAHRVDGGLIHELMHQIGIIDLYQMPVSRGSNEVITPDGLPVNMGFGFGRQGLMGGGDIAPHSPGAGQYMPEYCAAHDIYGLNSHVGYRRGYYGEYQYDVPALNHIQVLDSSGAPAAGVTVRVYQGGGGAMDAVPEAEGMTDAAGIFTLPNRTPVQQTTTETGHTLAPNPFGTIDVVGRNATLLVEVSRPGGDFDYRFLNMIDFNKAYWGGATDEWTQVLHTRLAGNSLPRIQGLGVALEVASTRLVWDPVPGAVSYRVYRAGRAYNRPDDPNHEYENYVFRAIGTTAATEYIDTTRYETSLYAVAPVASDGTEGPLSQRVFAPQLLNPWAVDLLPNGQRVVLDPQNGYAFLRQSADGVFIANTGSVHNHVEFSRFIAVDTNLQRLLTSHPTDWYAGPHSIRVTDYAGSLDGLFDIGSFGAGPGQFDDPAGVAVDDQSRIYVADRGNNRVQVLTADGTPLAQLGGFGSTPGQFNGPEGIAVGSDQRVFVCDPGNSRVQVLTYNPATQTLSPAGTLFGYSFNTPVAVTVGPSNNIFVSDHGTDAVVEFDFTGEWVRTHTTALYPYAGGFHDPSGLAVDAKGRVIVCDKGNRRVTLAYAPTIAADLNGDYYVNDADAAILADCLAGPALLPAVGCSAADLDLDSDVDLADLAELQREMDS
jgi:sugar lactone lactonase YvrE